MFVSKALIAHHAAGRDIGVASIFYPLGWRWMICCRFGVQFWFFDNRAPLFFLIHLFLRLLAIVLSKCGLGTGDFAKSVTIREYVLVCIVQSGYNEVNTKTC